MDTSLDAPNFQCAPKSVRPGDTITLRAEVPHGGSLAVKNPDDDQYFLIMPANLDRNGLSLMSPDTFATILILRFRADIRAVPRVYGRDSLERIFSKPGRYTFMITDQLASDQEGMLWNCAVRFSPNK